MFEPGDIVRYEGRVWDVDANAWETFDRGTHGDQPKARCVVVKYEPDSATDPDMLVSFPKHLRVRLERWPNEPYEYLIFDLDKIEST